jgi:hypothetical protein
MKSASKLALLCLFFCVLSSRADQTLTAAAKGKKAPADIQQGALIAFDGSTVKFFSQSKNQQVQYSATDVVITISVDPGSQTVQSPFHPTNMSGENGMPASNAISKSNTYQEPVNPGHMTYSIPTATKDTDLQQAEAQKAQAANQTSQSSPPIVDLTACHGRGQDWIVTVIGTDRNTLSGKIQSISNGVLMFQKDPKANAQKYSLPGVIVEIGIGKCQP